MDAAMYRLWPNGYMQCIGACEAFVDNGHTVTDQTWIK